MRDQDATTPRHEFAQPPALPSRAAIRKRRRLNSCVASLRDAAPAVKFGTLFGILGLICATDAAGQDICWPALAFKTVHFSEMQSPQLERKWTAVVAVDAAACEETSGPFFIGFSRLKENAPESNFQARFTWRAPSVEVSLDFSADEGVHRYWLGHVAPCACRQ